MFESLCQFAHEKLVRGTCPWCGHVIVDGRDVQRDIVTLTLANFDPWAKFDELAAKEGLGVNEAIQVLHAFLKTGNAPLRMMAATRLGEIGPDAKEALPMLSLLLQDTNRLVRDAAKEAIKRINEGGSGDPT